MSMRLLVGLDGHPSGERALVHAKTLAEAIGGCELLVVYVIEWSPYSFQTAEENAMRHKRREEEITLANERVVSPAVEALTSAGVNARGIVRHGDVADTLNKIAKDEKADQIIVGRSSDGSVAERIFGSTIMNLVMSAKVPVTVLS